MDSQIELRKRTFSTVLRRCFNDYYRGVIDGPTHASAMLLRWEKGPRHVCYGAIKDGETIGWIVYNRETSTIEEILMNPGKGLGAEAGVVDGLIGKENLVSAEILKTDVEKYRWMVEYGFRPTHAFSRNGTALLKMDLSMAVLFRRLQTATPAKAYRKREVVAIEKVPATQHYSEIRGSLRGLIARLGGLRKFVKPGQSVVIKPNLVSDHGLKDGVYRGGIVTDLRVIEALTEIFLPVAGQITIAEGSSINRSETAKMFAHYGYDKVTALNPEKVRLIDLNTDEEIEKPVPGGKRMLSRKIPRTLEQADVIISVPVLKIHFAAVASLSIKHLQGAVPPLEKYMTHFFGLWQNLVNIHHLIKPKLIIIDGLTGQEDFGPISGTPKTMNLFIGGTNPVAVDAVAMRVMGLDPVTSPPVRTAWMQGLGPIEEDAITVLGSPVSEVASPFKEPEINISSGNNIAIHASEACPGCRGYLHFVLAKLRRPDPQDPGSLLIDRPFCPKVNIFLGPATDIEIDPAERNIFMGICQQHHAEIGLHLPGCPPHAEVIVNGIFSLFPDVEKPKYADESEEEKLGKMLQEVLAMP